MLFGQPPSRSWEKDERGNLAAAKSVFSGSLVEQILHSHYGVRESSENLMVSALQENSFSGFLKYFLAPGLAGSESAELGDLLDIVAVCLEPDPVKRPSVESLLGCTMFRQSVQDVENSVIIIEKTLGYLTPSLSLKDKLLSQLSAFCLKQLKNSKFVLSQTQ